jgi:hypothetical protein
MGVNLDADDVANTVWQAANENVPVHNPVGLTFKLIKLLDKALPSASTRLLMRFLSRD